MTAQERVSEPKVMVSAAIAGLLEAFRQYDEAEKAGKHGDYFAVVCEYNKVKPHIADVPELGEYINEAEGWIFYPDGKTYHDPIRGIRPLAERLKSWKPGETISTYNCTDDVPLGDIAHELNISSRTLRRILKGDTRNEIKELFNKHIQHDRIHPGKYKYSLQMVKILTKAYRTPPVTK